MEILGIGPLELVFIFLIALIILGPTDMVKAGRTIGRFLRRVVVSPGWRSFVQASRELRTLPNKLIRDAGLEEDIQAINEISRQAKLPNLRSALSPLDPDISTWTTPPEAVEPADGPPASESYPEAGPQPPPGED